jgi:hypothetical protein
LHKPPTSCGKRCATRGAGAIGDKSAEDSKQGVDLANNPVAANARIATDTKTAINIGNLATGALALHDLAQRPRSVSVAVSKLFAARDVKEGYQSAKELMHQIDSTVTEKAMWLYRYF